MRTTHGDHIPGTRLGDSNPPIQPARCGGVESCPQCMEEAHAVNPLDYSRDEYFDEMTDRKVYRLIREAGINERLANYTMIYLKRHGILFRERKP